MNNKHLKKKKYFKKHFKEKNHFLIFLINHFSFFLIKLLILLTLFLFLGIFEFSFIGIIQNKPEIKIIESDEYKIFNKIKNKLKDSFFSTFMKEISIIKHVFTVKTKISKKSKNVIYITMSINNNKNYLYIVYVSIFSLLFNCNKEKSFFIYHMLCSPDFNESSIEIFKPLLRNYSQNVEMVFYNMGNLFANRIISWYPPSTFYRVFAPLIIDSDRIIHLDGDCIILSDLYEMYSLNFNDNYVYGIYDFISNGVDYLGIKSDKYINAGVILLNLKKIRKDNKIKELINITTNTDFKLRKNAQTAINYIFYPKIGRLPSKYGRFNFEDKDDLIFYNKKLRAKIPMEELEDALKNTTIIHLVLCNPKAWSVSATYYREYTSCRQRQNCSCKKYHDLWHFYAQKTEYYKIIENFTNAQK